MSIRVNLAAEEFIEAAKESNVIPIYTRLFSGTETALGIYEKLAKDRPGSFLLESAEHGVWARYSFVGVEARGFLSKSGIDTNIKWTSSSGQAALASGSEPDSNRVLDWVRAILDSWKTKPQLTDADPDFPPLSSGLVGVLGWDLVREIERLNARPTEDFTAPIAGLVQSQDLVVLDHQRSELVVISNAYIDDADALDSQYASCLQRIESMVASIRESTPVFLAASSSNRQPDFQANETETSFSGLVASAKNYVAAGDVFQVVISQRFDAPAPQDPLDAYRALRAMNPSPYMYFLNFEDSDGPYQIVGASPESLVQVRGRHAVTHPIAGSRPRGASLDQDDDLAQELRADQKERAEHLMLVDLARNDLLKVCESATVQVTEFMQIHRYSHVMHLVSTVEGDLRQDATSVDAFAATFPAGTLSGAPKPRALEIIDELESSARGIYGGVIGYFDYAGDADLAIAIRTAFIRDGVARIQAGAGIVLDSVAESEYQETLSKASSSLRSIATARAFEKM